MFETAKKNNDQAETKIEPIIDPRTIPIHTMKDDLDMLEGKASGQGVNTIPQAPKAPTPKIEIKKAPEYRPEPSSPFLKSGNPFGPNNAPNNAPNPNPLAAFANSPKNENSAPISKNIVIAKPHNWPLISGVLVLCVAILGILGGGYYFYMTRYNVPTVDIQSLEQVEVTPEVEMEEIAIPEKFAADKPNYLMIDVENSGVIEIQKIISDKAVEITEDGKDVPIEFVVVDQNNNPIAFKIFALLMKMNFSQKILDNLTDEFSLFVFNDQGSIRVALALNSENQALLSSEMKLAEKTLAKTMEPLFLGEEVDSFVRSFGDSQEGGLAIRYVNLDDQNSLSVDYWLNNGKLFIATSKNIGRAIISRMAMLGQ